MLQYLKNHFTNREIIILCSLPIFGLLSILFFILFLISCFITINWWYLLCGIFFFIGPRILFGNEIAYSLKDKLIKLRDELEKELENESFNKN